MGKVRRLRQKYHNLLKKDNEKKDEVQGVSYDDVVSGDFNKIQLPMNLEYDRLNPFSGLNINVDELKTTLEDDRVSVRSVAKSLKYDSKGKLLKKDEKRKLRHELFMKKLDIVNQARLESRKRNKKRPAKNETSNRSKGIVDNIPLLVPISEKKNIQPIKKRGIEKRKKRKQNMLEDIAALRSVIVDHENRADIFSTVAEQVQRRILEEAENE